MKELLEYVAKALVDFPEDVTVTEVDGDKVTTLELRGNEKDMGKVIGKQGRIAKSIRALIKAASGRESKRVVVEIVQ